MCLFSFNATKVDLDNFCMENIQNVHIQKKKKLRKKDHRRDYFSLQYIIIYISLKIRKFAS